MLSVTAVQLRNHLPGLAAAFSCVDPEHLAISHGQVIAIYNVATGETVHQLSTDSAGQCTSLAFGPKSTPYLAAACSSGLLLWDACTWQPHPVDKIGSCQLVTWSDGGSAVLAVSTSDSVIVLNSGKHVASISTKRISALRFGSMGRILAVGDATGSVAFWDWCSNEKRGAVACLPPVHVIDWQRNRLLVVAGGCTSLYAVEAPEAACCLQSRCGKVLAACFLSDTPFVVTAEASAVKLLHCDNFTDHREYAGRTGKYVGSPKLACSFSRLAVVRNAAWGSCTNYSFRRFATVQAASQECGQVVQQLEHELQESGWETLSPSFEEVKALTGSIQAEEDLEIQAKLQENQLQLSERHLEATERICAIVEHCRSRQLFPAALEQVGATEAEMAQREAEIEESTSRVVALQAKMAYYTTVLDATASLRELRQADSWAQLATKPPEDLASNTQKMLTALATIVPDAISTATALADDVNIIVNKLAAEEKECISHITSLQHVKSQHPMMRASCGSVRDAITRVDSLAVTTQEIRQRAVELFRGLATEWVASTSAYLDALTMRRIPSLREQLATARALRSTASVRRYEAELAAAVAEVAATEPRLQQISTRLDKRDTHVTPSPAVSTRRGLALTFRPNPGRNFLSVQSLAVGRTAWVDILDSLQGYAMSAGLDTFTLKDLLAKTASKSVDGASPSGSEVPTHPTRREQARLLYGLYSSDSWVYEHVNRALREDSLDRLEALAPYIVALLMLAPELASVTPQAGGLTLYRRTKLLPIQFAAYQSDVVFVWPGFTSTSRDADPHPAFGPVLFVITVPEHLVRFTVDLSAVSQFAEEQEVLLPANMAFEVTAVRAGPFGQVPCDNVVHIRALYQCSVV